MFTPGPVFSSTERCPVSEAGNWGRVLEVPIRPAPAAADLLTPSPSVYATVARR